MLDPAQIQYALDAKTKPPGSLGRLEILAGQLAQVQGSLTPQVDRQRICVFAASHGIAEEGVSAYPAAVTAQMVLNFLSGGAAICVLCRTQGIDLRVIDLGVDEGASPLPWDHSLLRRTAVRPTGTRSFLHEAAMTMEECQRALKIGAEEVTLAKTHGVQMLGLGEMGIGNTTSASALGIALTSLPLELLVGRGTGVDDAVLGKKQIIVRQALAYHSTSMNHPLDWLVAVGGYEIAAMTGAVLEAYAQKLPLVIDGFIGTAAVLVAHAMEPRVLEVCFFSHCSAESGHAPLLKYLGVRPILDLGLRLGEASGAALAMPILRAAAHMLSDMATFESAGISDKSNL
ncbi:nicotinate-nucleotide--dimethylbenzimidazole phosphoribosyltransferase [soil metagenome]